jgi:hypothetical protein
MFKTINELRRLRLIRELEEANAVDEEFKMETSLPEDHKVNYAKQSQFAPAKMGVSSFVGERYENKSNWTLGENKPNSKPNKTNFRKDESKPAVRVAGKPALAVAERQAK